uniref:Uncharacterized protein n=1 Tax=Vespula pensylvanica TaxID=30213 RepID=A0A834UEX4_VESPE|nr:hypothetical protein H0235_003092 [Vespula pensylvanica]
MAAMVMVSGCIPVKPFSASPAFGCSNFDHFLVIWYIENQSDFSLKKKKKRKKATSQWRYHQCTSTSLLLASSKGRAWRSKRRASSLPGFEAIADEVITRNGPIADQDRSQRYAICSFEDKLADSLTGTRTDDLVAPAPKL